MKRLASSLLVWTGLLVLIRTFSVSGPQAVGAPSMSSTGGTQCAGGGRGSRRAGTTL